MNDFSEVLENYEDKKNDNIPENTMPYSKEEWQEYKKQEREDIFKLIDNTAEEIVKSNDKFKTFLDVQSEFDQYSSANAMLITAQKPNAKQLRDFNSWKQAGASIRANEKAIKLLSLGNSEYVKDDGSVSVTYNVKNVYDISQVNTRQQNRTVSYSDNFILKSLLDSVPTSVKIKTVEKIGNSDKNVFYKPNENTLYVCKNGNPDNIFYETTNELAKIEIGNKTELDSFKSMCVSYMLCKKYGIDVSNYKITVPQEFKNIEPKEIREQLKPISDSMKKINTQITKVMGKSIKENNRTQAR